MTFMGFKSCFYNIAFQLTYIYFYNFDREGLGGGVVYILCREGQITKLLLDNFRVIGRLFSPEHSGSFTSLLNLLLSSLTKGSMSS